MPETIESNTWLRRNLHVVDVVELVAAAAKES
jgi:hypothetical protein